MIRGLSLFFSNEIDTFPAKATLWEFAGLAVVSLPLVLIMTEGYFLTWETTWRDLPSPHYYLQHKHSQNSSQAPRGSLSWAPCSTSLTHRSVVASSSADWESVAHIGGNDLLDLIQPLSVNAKKRTQVSRFTSHCLAYCFLSLKLPFVFSVTGGLPKPCTASKSFCFSFKRSKPRSRNLSHRLSDPFSFLCVHKKHTGESTIASLIH